MSTPDDLPDGFDALLRPALVTLVAGIALDLRYLRTAYTETK